MLTLECRDHTPRGRRQPRARSSRRGAGPMVRGAQYRLSCRFCFVGELTSHDKLASPQVLASGSSWPLRKLASLVELPKLSRCNTIILTAREVGTLCTRRTGCTGTWKLYSPSWPHPPAWGEGGGESESRLSHSAAASSCWL